MQITDFCDKLYNKDGVIVVHNPHGEYDYSEVVKWANENPDMVEPWPEDSLDDVKAELRKKIEEIRPTLWDKLTFDHNGDKIQLDQEAQVNLSGLYAMRNAVQYPKYWRKLDNSFLVLSNAQDVEALSVSMFVAKDAIYSQIFSAKDAINCASTVDEAKTIFQTWLSGLENPT